MTKRTLLASSLAALALPLFSAQAEAQCDPGAVFCAEIEVNGQVEVAPPPPPAEVVVQPVQPPPPQGQVVVVQPAPPPPQVQVAPPPPRTTTVVVTQQPQRLVLRQPRQRLRRFSLNARVGTMISDRLRMGGLEGSIRFRPARIFGVEFAVGAYAGNDYNDMDRVEIPVTFNFMFWLPKASRLQVYFLAGAGLSHARTEGVHSGYGEFMSRDMTYIGAQGGIGLEWRINPRFALSMDVRAFIRTRIDADDLPEFYNPDTGQTADTSAGAVGTLGAHFYF